MPVRNGVLCRLATPAAPGAYVIGTVPPTDTWIVKDIHVFNLNAAPQAIVIAAENAGSTIDAILYSATLGANLSASVSEFLCMAPTDFLVVQIGAGPVHVWVSGADLPGHL